MLYINLSKIKINLILYVSLAYKNHLGCSIIKLWFCSEEVATKHGHHDDCIFTSKLPPPSHGTNGKTQTRQHSSSLEAWHVFPTVLTLYGRGVINTGTASWISKNVSF